MMISLFIARSDLSSHLPPLVGNVIHKAKVCPHSFISVCRLPDIGVQLDLNRRCKTAGRYALPFGIHRVFPVAHHQRRVRRYER
jgi:hypothetical protein